MPPENAPPPHSSDVNDVYAVITEIRELSRINGKPLFQLAMDVAAFTNLTSPSGDPLGTLTAVSRSGVVLVAPILCVHQDDNGELWHTTEKPLQPGTAVRVTLFHTENSSA